MTQPDLEDLLRRYRPAGPPAELRARVVTDGAVVRRVWPWATAAAALLVAVVGLRAMTRDVYQDVRRSFPSTHDVDLEELPALRAAVNDDELLRRLLEDARNRERQELMDAPTPLGPSWQ